MKTSLLLAASLAAAILCRAADPAPASPLRRPPPVEPTPEMLAKYRAMSDAELRQALNDVSDRSIQAMREARDQERDIAYSLQTESFQGEEVETARARIDELRRALAEAEAAYRAAVLALPEMKERAEALEKAKKSATDLQRERAAVRAVMAERRPNPGPRPGNPLSADAPAPAPAPANPPAP